MLSYSGMSATAANLCLLCSMVLPFGMSMLGGGGIAPVTCCSTVNSRCDLFAGAGSRVERNYTIIRPYAMHCATDREAEDRRGLRILRRSEPRLLSGSIALPLQINLQGA